MKKNFFVLLIVSAVLLTIGLLALPNSEALAQAGGPGCVDASGAPCTATPEPSGGSGGGGNRPTNTPLPITNPTEEVETAGATWSGTCKGTIQETTTCIGQFTNGCGHVGGSTSSTVNTDGSVDLTCTVPLILPTPDPGSQITAPEFPLPEDGFLGTCTSDTLSECLDRYKCEDGLLVIEVDLYSGNGTQYDFYCIPHESDVLREFPLTQPLDDEGTEYGGVCHYGDGFDKCVSDFVAQCDEDGGLYNEIDSGKGAVVTVCELPQSQVAPTEVPDIVAAPADDGSTEGNEDWEESCTWNICLGLSISCWMDGGTGVGYEDGQGGFIFSCDVPAESSNLPPFGFGFLIGVFAAVAIPAFMKNARKAKTAEAVTNVKKMYDTSDSMPQTKEHILLNKDDNSQSANKPKPTPPTPPKPPSKTISGDFDSDGDVDGRDF